MNDSHASETNGTQHGGVGPVVLAVDDDPVFLAIMREVLLHKGAASVATIEDGGEGLEILRRDPAGIDVITLDLSMPNLDGVQFLRGAGELGFKGRLILISGEHRSVLASAAKLADMSNIDCVAALSKPVDFDHVAELVLSPTRVRERTAPASLDFEEINAGLRTSRLVAYYQPQVDLQTGRLVGAEALARMHNADGDILDAGDMINLAEEHGRITDITWRMIETVTEDAARLTRQLSAPLTLAFNISSSILSNDGFPEQLADIVRLSGMRPEDFIVELTESRIPANASQSLEALTRIRLNGFGLAIDDFGTGYSNIEQLRLFPFSQLKIDKDFMMAAHEDSFALAVIEASVALARQLDLKIVAEGVETETQLELARKYGMNEAQGYLFSRPLPFEDFAEFATASVSSLLPVSSVA